MEATQDRIVDKIAKLLALAESTSEHEAAAALGRATELMTKHQIEEATVRLRGEAPPDEAVSAAEPVGVYKQIDQWRQELAHGIATGLGLAMFWAWRETPRADREAAAREDLIKRGASPNDPGFQHKVWKLADKGRATLGVRFVGKPSIVRTAAYLLAYLDNEINRLTEVAYHVAKACDRRVSPRSWRTSFRLGAAQVIAGRMMAERRRMVPRVATPGESASVALVRNDALAVQTEYERISKVLNLKTSTRSISVRDGSAYAQGRDAGARVNLDGGGKGLGAGQKRLGGGS